ncbi:MAG: hypothetical protein Fur0021_21770 [Candidatus Promineifilaceae bacterium]
MRATWREGDKMNSQPHTNSFRVIPFIMFVIGTALSLISLGAELLGLDLTPGFGIVQMAELLLGLTLLTSAAFIHIRFTRRRNAPRSLQADIGVRLAATGLVFAYVSGLSDLLQIGTHLEPAFERPYVGPLQLGGIALGILSIVAGILLYYTSRGSHETSALGFLVKDENQEQPAAVSE